LDTFVALERERIEEISAAIARGINPSAIVLPPPGSGTALTVVFVLPDVLPLVFPEVDVLVLPLVLPAVDVLVLVVVEPAVDVLVDVLVAVLVAVPVAVLVAVDVLVVVLVAVDVLVAVLVAVPVVEPVLPLPPVVVPFGIKTIGRRGSSDVRCGEIEATSGDVKAVGLTSTGTFGWNIGAICWMGTIC
jgi:hypothetical protein